MEKVEFCYNIVSSKRRHFGEDIGKKSLKDYEPLYECDRCTAPKIFDAPQMVDIKDCPLMREGY